MKKHLVIMFYYWYVYAVELDFTYSEPSLSVASLKTFPEVQTLYQNLHFGGRIEILSTHIFFIGIG